MIESEQAWSQAFEDRANDWARVYAENLGHRAFARRLRIQIGVEFVRRHCGGTDKTALDLGCGPGVLCAELAKLGYRTTGVDYAEGMLAAARETVEKEKVGELCQFHFGDFNEINLPERSFDVIVGLGFVEYIFDTDRLYKKVTRLMRPSGIFVVQIWNKNSLVNLLDFKAGPLRLINPWVVFPKLWRSLFPPTAPANSIKAERLARKWYTPRSLDQMLQRHGFVRIDSAGHVFGNLHYGETRWFSEAKAIRIDRRFWSWAQHPCFRWLQYFSDNYIVVYKFRE